jgi:tRNA-specific 2-thiouridylase
MKVLCAMSGGVDSSVAALELLQAGHEVVGLTMRLWGGASDTGCCSIADVDDARRVAQQLDIDHLVFNFTDDFDEHVVQPYVDAHASGTTPNPCIECNRHLKFHRLSERADLLGFDAIATGHHARIVDHLGHRHVARGADPQKDQSYVVHMLPAHELERTLFPVGHLTKVQVRERATAAGLRTADKPDSQDVCFITHTGGRTQFLGDRIAFHPGRVVDLEGHAIGSVDAVEMVTVGQRRGVGLPGGGPKQYVVDVDVPRRVVTVGSDRDLYDDRVRVDQWTWVAGAPEGASAGRVLVQCSAHGAARAATIDGTDVVWDDPQRRVAPGQTLVAYDVGNERVLGGGIVTARHA